MTPQEKETLRDRIADRLVDMESIFNSRCKLTFVMRSPHLPDGDLIVTSDDIHAVIGALHRLATYPSVGEESKALAPSSQASTVEIIVNGQPVTVPCGPVRDVIGAAITASGQIGAPIDQWELRTQDGDVIPHALPGGVEWALTGGQRFFLNLGLPPAGPSSQATPPDLLDRFVWLMERTLTAPSDGLRRVRAGTLVYWDGGHAESFTTDVLKAVHWPTKEAAQQQCPPEHYAQWGWRYVEHGFMRAASSQGDPPPDSQEDIEAHPWKRDQSNQKGGSDEERDEKRAVVPSASDLRDGLVSDRPPVLCGVQPEGVEAPTRHRPGAVVPSVPNGGDSGQPSESPIEAENRRLCELVEQIEEVEEQRFDFAAHLQRQREFSERTFGPGARTIGVVDHIRKELQEIEADPSDIAEWIDVTILALDGAWRAGYTSEQIIDALQAKQAKNEARAWPDWHTADADKVIEHVREREAAPSSQATPPEEGDGPHTGDDELLDALTGARVALESCEEDPDVNPTEAIADALGELTKADAIRVAELRAAASSPATGAPAQVDYTAVQAALAFRRWVKTPDIAPDEDLIEAMAALVEQHLNSEPDEEMAAPSSSPAPSGMVKECPTCGPAGSRQPTSTCPTCDGAATVAISANVIDTSATYERVHDTSETLPRIDPQAVAERLGAAEQLTAPSVRWVPELGCAVGPASSQATPPPRCKNCGATSPTTDCDVTGFACEMAASTATGAPKFDSDRDSTCEWNCTKEFPHDGPCGAAPSSSPAPSGRRHEDDEKIATRSPSPDVIPATGSPRSPCTGDSIGWQIREVIRKRTCQEEWSGGAHYTFDCGDTGPLCQRCESLAEDVEELLAVDGGRVSPSMPVQPGDAETSSKEPA